MARPEALCLALALSLTPVVAHADDLPLRKEGLWDVTTSRTGSPQMPKVQMCVDAASQAQLTAMGKDAMKNFDCSKSESHRDGNVYTRDSVCKFMGSTQTTHTVITTISDTEYTSEISAHTDPPRKNGKADSKMTQHGRWVGPCGPGMKPGDMMMNGHKIHF
jgi:hypothetical protein